jgi:uncharacterized membrane protein YhaH (DUF805 family)
MNFGDAVSSCFSEFADFNGRGRRSQYWWFYLFTWIISIFANAANFFPVAGPLIALPLSLVLLVLYIPLWAAGSRRLHDTDRSGWWQLGTWVPATIALVFAGIAFLKNGGIERDPDVGWLGVAALFYLAAAIMWVVLTVWMASDSQPGPNRFGPSPK